MGKFIYEFKEFAVKGNAVDMAVGVIIGGAFGKIVSSIVDDIIMPPIGWIIGGVNFTDLKITLPAEQIAGQTLPAATINYGLGHRAARASHHQLWQLPADYARLRHHRPLCVPSRQGHQQACTQECRGCQGGGSQGS